jgi:hypothetical protein
MLPSEAEKIRLKILRKMPPEQKLKIVFNLNALTRKITIDGIKNQYPNISPEELKKQISFRSKND